MVFKSVNLRVKIDMIINGVMCFKKRVETINVIRNQDCLLTLKFV